MQWVINYLIEAMKDWLNSNGAIVDRGSTPHYDFYRDDFTIDGSFHELDLSEIVPEGAKSVLISVQGTASTDNAFAFFAKPPGTGNENIGTLILPTRLELIVVNISVALSDDRKISYRIDSTTWYNLQLIIRAWTF